MAVQLGAMRRSGWDQISGRRGTARRAFTLVELLVVIGIIAVLVSILLPTLAAARSKAQIIQCESNVRQLVIAAMMFANDHQGYIPTFTDNTGAQYNDPEHRKFSYRNNTNAQGAALSTGGSVVVFDWASSLIPYLGGQTGQSFETAAQSQSKVFRCPADPWLNVPAAAANAANDTFTGPGYDLLNNVTTQGYYAISYGINADVASLVSGPSFAGGGAGYAQDGAKDYIGVVGGPNPYNVSAYRNSNVGVSAQCRLLNVYEPSQVMLFADCGTRPQNYNGQSNYAMNRNDELAYTTNYNSSSVSGIGDEGTLLGELTCKWLQLRVPTNRHNGVICVGFCDGHAEAVPAAFYHKVRISPWNWQK